MDNQPQLQDAAHSQQERVDDTDLLIRSMTTLLYLVGHKVGTSQDRPDTARQGHLLDRIALSFVSGAKPADVAAVIYWDHASHRLFVDAVQASHGYDLIKTRSLR